MYIAYYDEAGDDGLKTGSSEMFVLTALYMHHRDWKENYNAIRNFRWRVAKASSLPIREEFHARKFLRNREPYNKRGISLAQRLDIITSMCDELSALKCRIVNVVINKQHIVGQDYPVLDRAFTYSIQRIENDIQDGNEKAPFLIITDQGRVGKMKATARKIRQVNYIPSRITPGTTYERDIEYLIEDPLPKDSNDSYFIQASDLVSLIVYMHMRARIGVGLYGIIPGMDSDQATAQVEDWMTRLQGSLNLEASIDNPYGYGIVCYPQSK